MMKRPWLVPAVLGVNLSLSPLLLFAQQGDDWIDPSPHSTTFVTVADDVEVEVLDWGGSGQPILLLAGLGDTAHVFDDFGPTLTERHRVYAMSRRGFGKSSAPDSGYGFDRLAEDVIRVIDALALARPIIVGHSFAGEEMHVLGDRHGSDVAGLVYIDAAFNRADDSADYDAKLRELPQNSPPQPSDLGAIATLRDYFARNEMPSYPEAETRNKYVVDPDGNISGQRTPAPAVREGISVTMREAMVDYDPEPIRVPALAIYAVPGEPEDLMRPWYDRSDRSVQQDVEELFALARERYERHAEWFRSFSQDSSRVVGISGAHHLFITNASKVKEEIEAFASSLD